MDRRILILGAGYGGLNTALHLEKRLSRSQQRDWEILLVDRHSYHQHIILLHEVAANSAPPEEAMVPLANLLRGKRISFMQGEVNAVDLEQGQVTFDSRQMDYHRLVIALGSETSFFGIPGAAENSLTLKSVDDARRINAQIRRMFALARTAPHEERQAMLTFAVCGGGYTGVELAGELADWLPELAIANEIPLTDVRLLVVEAAPTILLGYPADLPRRATEILEEKGVELKVASPVAKVEPGVVYVKSGESIPARTIIWTGGVEAPRVLAQWGLQTGVKGRAVVNGYLESANRPGVYVIGDSSLVVDPSTGRPLAPSAQVALQHASCVADNIMAELVGGRRRVFRPAPTGEVFSLGRKRAFAIFGPISFDGYAARLLKEAIALRYYYTIGGLGLVMEKLPAAWRATRGAPRVLLPRR